MAPTHEARVEVLEVKVQTLEEKVENLETNAGPGRADAQSGNLAELRRQFAEFGEVQAKQSQSIDIVTGKFNGLKEASSDYAFKLVVLDSGVRQLKDEVSGKFARLDNDVAGLKGDFAWLRGQFNDGGLLVGLSQDMMKLRDDVTGIEVKVDTLQDDVTVLKADVTVLKADVSELKSDVSELKSDVSELKSDVSELKSDMADVKVSLKEILNRLPPKAA
jgi:chromosome segregation ATPase